LLTAWLTQVVNGMSDNLLTSVIRAWDTDSSIDMKKKIIVVAPAMNSVNIHPQTIQDSVTNSVICV